jgi:WD repeat-containing protein 24
VQHHASELSKALGDPPAQIATQSMATYAQDLSASDLKTFMTLAKRYVFEGRDRTDICAYNSGVKPVYHCVMNVPFNYF